MKPVFIRRNRRRSITAKPDSAFFKKESQETFFGGGQHDTFFQPVASPAASTPATQAVQRKCAECENEDKELQRQTDKKEDEKLMRAADPKEEEKVQREPDKKDEEKIQRKCAECEGEEKSVQREPDKKEEEKVMRAEDKKEDEKIQKKDNGSSSSSGNVSSYIGGLGSKGNPLPPSANQFFSSRMGYDFSDVKVHTDTEAVSSAKSLNAKAYAIGNNVVFNSGQYNTDTTTGQRLLAHELTHVVQQGGSPKKIQKVDADFEDITGVGNAILDNKMKKDGSMGKTFTAPNCRSIHGCNVGFKFDKAYKGEYLFKAGRRYIRGVYAKIVGVYDPKICGACDRIRLIQVIRYVKQGTKGNMETSEPTSDQRRKRAGWNDPKARSKGWFVDELDTGSQPFWDDPSKPSTFDGQTGVGDKPPILWDAPGSFMEWTNDGKEFQTFMVCEPKTGGKGKVIGGVNWGYYINSTGDISFMPASPIPTCGPTEELQNASERWDTMGSVAFSRINFAAEKPVNHHGSQSALYFNEGDVNIQNNQFANSEEIYELALRKIRQHLMAAKASSKITLHCYSGKGEGELNVDLSLFRADNIRSRLVAAGIPEDVIEIQQHKGETVNAAKFGENRRVVIEISDMVSKAIKTLMRPF